MQLREAVSLVSLDRMPHDRLRHDCDQYSPRMQRASLLPVLRLLGIDGIARVYLTQATTDLQQAEERWAGAQAALKAVFAS